MARIQKIDERNLYQNPLPAVRSRQATFPSVCKLPNGKLLALFVIGEAFEAANARVYCSRSADNGKSWQFQGPLYDQEKFHWPYQFSESLKPLLLKDGTLIATGYGFERYNPDRGIGDSETGSFPPGRNVICFSKDYGKTWTDPVPLRYGADEMLEMSGPSIQLDSGVIIAAAPPFNTNPNSQKGCVIASSDAGRTWHLLGTFFQSPQGNIAPWETRICQMQSDRVVGIFWAFDVVKQQHLPNQVTVSHDGGRSWFPAIDTGHMGQASNLMWLGGEKLLSIHAHRAGEVGLYVRLVDFSNDRWRVEEETVIWGRAPSQNTASDIMQQFANLKFGQPSLVSLDNGHILAVHWCVEDGLYVIKTHLLHVQF